MKNIGQWLRMLTNDNLGALGKPFLYSLLQSFLQGQPYFVILMVMLELLSPLMNPGSELNTRRLILFTGWLAAALLLLFFTGRKKFMTEMKTAYGISAQGRLSLGDHLRKLSMGFFKGRDSGDITALMLQDYTNVEMLLAHSLLEVVGAVLLPVVFLIFLVPYDWRMALITVAPVPAAVLAAIIARRVVSRLGRRQIEAKNNASSRMIEYLGGMRSIKSYNLQGEKFTRLKQSFEYLRRVSIRLEGIAGPSVVVGVWCLNAGIALIMLIGTVLVTTGTLSIPYFLFFLIIGTRMYDPLTKVLITFAELAYCAVSAGRINTIRRTAPLGEPNENAGVRGHSIEFRDVSFRYHDTDVLRNVSFTLPENTMTALVGPSGSGKTTVTRLIARFWDAASGEIRVGGHPAGGMPSEELLAKIAIVFQDVYLFNDTIEANIKVGNPSASMDEVRAAARKARCDEFITALEAGYDTMVGEGGATLSGGEKQRISIARAILKDAPIVLLDEATASLDPENELYIQRAVGELVKGRTLIVIAHRLSTVTHADKILVLDKGSLVEEGRHDELLARDGGLYRRMWDEQAKAHSWKLGSGGGGLT